MCQTRANIEWCRAVLGLSAAAAAQAKVVIPIHDSIGGTQTAKLTPHCRGIKT